MAFALLVIPLLPSCKQKDEDVARAGGRTITGNDVDVAAKKRYGEHITDALRKEALAGLLREQLLAVKARKAGLDDQALRLELENQERRLLAGRYEEHYLAERLSEAELRRFFDEHRKEFRQIRVDVSHILVRFPLASGEASRRAARSKADRILQLASGKLDFGDLARQFSDDAKTRESGGLLGWLGPRDVLDAVYRSALKLKPGEVTGPVESPLGYHIVKLNSPPKLVEQPFEELKGLLEIRRRREVLAELDSEIAAGGSYEVFDTKFKDVKPSKGFHSLMPSGFLSQTDETLSGWETGEHQGNSPTQGAKTEKRPQ